MVYIKKSALKVFDIDIEIHTFIMYKYILPLRSQKKKVLYSVATKGLWKAKGPSTEMVTTVSGRGRFLVLSDKIPWYLFILLAKMIYSKYVPCYTFNNTIHYSKCDIVSGIKTLWKA